MAKAHRQYKNDYPSVTTVLGVLRKIGLEMWYKTNTIQFINAAMAKGKLVGTQTHKAIEHYILTGEAKIETEYPDEVTNALKSFMLFRKENPDIKLTLSEQPLTSEIYKYNGTLDAPNPPILVDWKTTEKKDKEKPPIYDEAKYQTAAYVNLWNENHPDNPINTVYVVAIAKDCVAYNICKIEAEELIGYFTEVFLSCLKIIHHQKRKVE